MYREMIYANRTAQLDKKHFQDALQKLDSQEKAIRALRRQRYQAEGHTPEEAEWLVRHTSGANLSNLPEPEQIKLKSEIDSMWATVPEEFREKAKKMATSGSVLI